MMVQRKMALLSYPMPEGTLETYMVERNNKNNPSQNKKQWTECRKGPLSAGTLTHYSVLISLGRGMEEGNSALHPRRRVVLTPDGRQIPIPPPGEYLGLQMANTAFAVSARPRNSPKPSPTCNELVSESPNYCAPFKHQGLLQNIIVFIPYTM
ncbi:hypothetical protein LX32DRAFT_398493 [Colletotrichum zoysiae]|uniref:Uncharacterized protein n=1 Tax=Colletotrichum zoysiae TaxID=1216348 RepID=A0AAD9HT03_9PEZI|nr:hypothetical protein LX32DRAFT_398493 [Colletotrichum zoysiae]